MNFQSENYLGRIWTQTEKGQTLVEYALIILLVAIVVIVVLELLGGDISAIFDSIRDTFTS